MRIPINLSRWQKVFSKKNQVLNIFCTMGQTLNAPGHYQKPLDLFDSAFNFLVVDEAGQVLEGNGQHLGKYASQILLAGDVAQLPAYCYLPDEHHALMRAAATSMCVGCAILSSGAFVLRQPTSTPCWSASVPPYSRFRLCPRSEDGSRGNGRRGAQHPRS